MQTEVCEISAGLRVLRYIGQILREHAEPGADSVSFGADIPILAIGARCDIRLSMGLKFGRKLKSCGNFLRWLRRLDAPRNAPRPIMLVPDLSRADTLWRSTGTPCYGYSCRGWRTLDNNPASVRIAASSTALYQLHSDGKIWRFTGSACSATSCPGWQMLDNNPARVNRRTVDGTVYKFTTKTIPMSISEAVRELHPYHGWVGKK